MKEEIYLATIETLTQKIVDLKEENANIKKEHEVQMQCMRDRAIRRTLEALLTRPFF